MSCPDCQSPAIEPSRLPGLSKCKECGKVFIGKPPKDDRPLPPLEDGFVPDVPDYLEVMVGWRAWRIEDTRVGPKLHSPVVQDFIWEPRQVAVALCNEGSGHPIPGPRHGCGLYSAKDKDHLLSMGYHNYDGVTFHAVGPVSVWGRVIEGTAGWRAQFGYPRELFVPYEAWQYAKPLKDAYGVPVRLNNFLGSKV